MLLLCMFLDIVLEEGVVMHLLVMVGASALSESRANPVARFGAWFGP